jgi:hypothetical protein
MLVVALLVAMVFGPVTARAAGTLVSIVDPSTGVKAHVVNGQLEVGDGHGALTVDGSVKATFPSPQPVAGTVNVRNTAGAPLHVSVDNTLNAPIPINGAVTVTNTLNARQALPEQPFSAFQTGNGTDTVNLFATGPGDQLAVSSFTIENVGDTTDTVAFRIAGFSGGLCLPGGQEITEVSVAPSQTTHIEYPQPFLVNLPANSCLAAHVDGSQATKITAVGFLAT